VKQYIMHRTDGKGVDVAAGDGGFEIKMMNGGHKENLQELFSHRIKVSEVLFALETLRGGGAFILKLFDTMSWLMTSLIYTCARVFERVHIVKPFRSRIVNSERYLVCTNYGGMSSKDERYGLVEALREVHRRFEHENAGDPHERSAFSVVPEETVKQDVNFMTSLQAATRQLAHKQTTALKHVIDTAEAKAQDDRELHIRPDKKRKR